MLFIAEQRVAHQPGLALLTPRDIVEMLKETLPRKPEGKDALVARINQRHERRRGAIASRFRTQSLTRIAVATPWALESLEIMLSQGPHTAARRRDISLTLAM
jgi:hypothetical protein